MSTHLAIEMHNYGDPGVLEVVRRTTSEPGPGEVRIRNVIAGVNRADCFVRAGEWAQAGGWPYVPGLEACGHVDAVGDGVDDVAPGDPVLTMMQRMAGVHGQRPGGYQELVIVPASTLARVPAPLDVWSAGELGLPAVTALLSLRALQVDRGMRVLVQGASGAVGQVAVQLCKAMGAVVIATGTSPAKFDFVKACGASFVIDTRDPDWLKRVVRVDRVLDLVGTATFGPSVQALVPGGRLVFAGGTTGGELSFTGWNLMRPITLTGWSAESLTRPQLQDAMNELGWRFARGELRVRGLTEFPLDHAIDAHRAIEAGRHAGRVVLRA